MSKRGKIKILLTVLILIAFSVTVFAIPTLKAKRFWFAYLCGVFAILFQIYAIQASDGMRDTKDRYFGLPVGRLSIYYLVLQLAASITEIATVMPTWAVLLINMLLFAFPVIGYITTQTVKRELARQEAKQQETA